MLPNTVKMQVGYGIVDHEKMKKIALVLASIHTGTSVTLWKEIAYQENREYLRNETYTRVNPDNVGLGKCTSNQANRNAWLEEFKKLGGQAWNDAGVAFMKENNLLN